MSVWLPGPFWRFPPFGGGRRSHHSFLCRAERHRTRCFRRFRRGPSPSRKSPPSIEVTRRGPVDRLLRSSPRHRQTTSSPRTSRPNQQRSSLATWPRRGWDVLETIDRADDPDSLEHAATGVVEWATSTHGPDSVVVLATQGPDDSLERLLRTTRSERTTSRLWKRCRESTLSIRCSATRTPTRSSPY